MTPHSRFWWARSIALLACSVAMVGCDFDPYAGNSDSGKARIINDEPYAVDIMLCEEEDCGKPSPVLVFLERYRHRHTFPAGYDNPRGLFNVSKRGVPSVHLVVRTATGKPLGCLPFVMPEPGPRSSQECLSGFHAVDT